MATDPALALRLVVAQEEQLRAERTRVAALGERTRIAGEIHDVLAHSLSALSIQLQAVRALLDAGESDRAGELIDRAHRLAADGLGETRRAGRVLRGDHRDLDVQLREVVETHRRRYGTSVGFLAYGDLADLTPDRSLALLRVVQQALVEAVERTPGGAVEVVIWGRSDHVEVMVASAEPGTASTGAALDDGGVRERLLGLGGTVRTGSHGDRWVVRASVPR